MIRTTSRRLTTCFNDSEPGERTHVRPQPAATCPALRRRAFRCLALTIGLVLPTTLLAAPVGIDIDFNDNDILATLPATAPVVNDQRSTAQQAADMVQRYIHQARTEGDPRYLGYARALLDRWPENNMTDRLVVLDATVHQSLHQFQMARELLSEVVQSGDRIQRIQARLTLANLELVQGNYTAAHTHCEQLASTLPGLISTSCLAHVQARTGQASTAYATLLTAIQNAPHPDPTSLIWAEGTLADIATQLGRPEAGEHWQKVLTMAPEDLYARAQLADWLLEQGDTEAVVALTDTYEHVDELAVIRAIAMKRQNHEGADQLAARLKGRLDEALWRGNLLHQRDLARYALDIADEADSALQYALSNWQEQREPMDTRLLLRAANRLDDQAVLNNVRSWLQRHNQQDARYPDWETP